MNRHRLPLIIAGAASALALSAAPALGVSTPELVQGTTTSTLALTAGTGALFTTFGPGVTASQTGALTATDTSPSWTLTARDAGSGAGHLVAAATGCSGSDSQIANSTQVKVDSLVSGVTSAGTITLSGTDQTVASSTTALLASSLLTSHYSVVIPSTEKMLTGCIYSQNVTYTLQ
jgi:hypothetical protein